jgi:hypothetical protein
MPDITYYRLPDGAVTDDVRELVRGWDDLIKPLEALGFHTIGFDPGLTLCDKQTGGGEFTIPVWAAARFLAAIGRTNA